MKKLFTIILILLLFSCKEKSSDCDEHSKPYYSFTYDIGLKEKYHNTKLKGENIAIRKAFQEIMNTETEINPKNGYITLRLHLDKNGNFCNQESFEIDKEYQPTEFNNGELIKKLKNISNGLLGWTNDTETKTFYLIRFKIKGGVIEEVF